VAEYILSEANQGGDKVELMPVFNIAGNAASSAIAQEINDYNSAVLEYQRLCNESQSNPIIDDLRGELRSMHYAIVATLQAHIEGLRLQIASISKRQEATYGDMKLSPNKEKELVALMRDQSVKQELYMYLKQKAEETQITRAAADSNCRIIDRAHGSDKPISPKTWLIYTLAIIIGSVLPFLILYIRELLNTKVRSHKDIEEALSVPMLGIVPRHEGKMERSGIVVREDGRDMVSEAFRILRTNLSFMSVDNPVKVIMLTSSVPHSGKTFVASNLATTLSQAGGKVLLMDLDLRRRTLTKLMGHRNDRRGVTSYLTGAIENLKDIITHDEEHGGLDMIFSGPQPPNPTELLMSKRMADLVLSLREMYDYIIIDSVPALSVADAMVIDRYVDHTIYVVRQGNLDRRQLPDIERLHTDKRLHSMSIVFNGATITKRSYGYGYGYGYSYGYDDELSPWRRRWRAFKRLFKKR
jgi:capsular exopolysaccharide synthesis family protein